MIRLDLPIPPSVNGAYGNRPKGQRGKGRYPTKALSDWKAAAGWTLQTQLSLRLLARLPKSVSGPYRLRIFVDEEMPGDVDNRVKPISDLLVTHGVTPDDRRASGMLVDRRTDVGVGRCVVEVEAVG